MRRFLHLAVVVGCIVLAGCTTRADLIAQDRRVAQQLAEQRKQIQALQREVESLRGDVETGGGKTGGSGGGDHVQELEDRVTKLEGKRPVEPDVAPEGPATASPPGPSPTPAPVPSPAIARDTAPRPVPAPVEDPWQRDVARDQQAVDATNAPERAEFDAVIDSVAKKDCGRAVSQLNSFAAQKKDSPLASNALYWAARCYALKGDRNQAISKFYDVVTKYPKGSKAPAALWEQGNLFIEIGDTPDARLALGKLIKDYPNSEEAGRARKRLTELDR